MKEPVASGRKVMGRCQVFLWVWQEASVPSSLPVSTSSQVISLQGPHTNDEGDGGTSRVEGNR